MRFLILFCSFLTLGILNISAAPHTQESQIKDYPSQLHNVMQKIHQLPEARQLIATVQKSGPVHIQISKDPSQQFKAFWEGSARLICVAMNPQTTEGSLISSIIFELHNAKTDPRLEELTQQARTGKINKEYYVEQVERMEHGNAIGTVSLLKKGIQQGVFPPSAELGVIDDFEEHYRTQQLAGHSQWIADQYNDYNPHSKHIAYKGTIPGLQQMSRQDKETMLYFYSLKCDLEHADKGIVADAQRELHVELQNLNRPNSNNHQISKRRSLFQQVFKKSPALA